MAAVEQAFGFGITLLFLADIFVTVLYARADAGLLAPRVGRLLWRVFRAVGRLLARPAQVLSFCGPAILVTVLAFWVCGLTLGAALVIHPELGRGVVSGSGPTRTDFLTALEASGSSLSIVGAGGYSPATGLMQLLYLFNSLVGVSVLSLTLTYLMQVYTALRTRNVLAMDLHLLSAETDDAAELLVRLAPDGNVGRAAETLAGLAGRITAEKESHHFYPVLVWFRFPESHYAVSRIALFGLDTVALIRTALDARRTEALRESASIEQLGRASWLLLTTVEQAIEGRAEHPTPAPGDTERWRRRYGAALRRLREAGLPTVVDEHAGAEAYAALRVVWEPRVRRVAEAMAYDTREIDPGGERAGSTATVVGGGTTRM